MSLRFVALSARLAAVLAVLAVFGCSAYDALYEKPGATDRDLARAKAECGHLAQAHTGVSGFSTPQGGFFVSGGGSYIDDQIFEDCMKGRGWDRVEGT